MQHRVQSDLTDLTPFCAQVAHIDELITDIQRRQPRISPMKMFEIQPSLIPSVAKSNDTVHPRVRGINSFDLSVCRCHGKLDDRYGSVCSDQPLM